MQFTHSQQFFVLDQNENYPNGSVRAHHCYCQHDNIDLEAKTSDIRPHEHPQS